MIQTCSSGACLSSGCIYTPLQLDDVVECVLDVWLEISLNGKDFTATSMINFRYYNQPSPARFGPSGGPIEGSTELLLEADSGGGFQRLNDGSITVDIGGTLVRCEEVQGKVILSDDFDPTADEVRPTEEQLRQIYPAVQTPENGTAPNSSALVSGDNVTILFSSLVTLSEEEAIDANRAAYRFDRSLWETGEGVVADSECGGLPIDRVLNAVQQGGNDQGILSTSLFPHTACMSPTFSPFIPRAPAFPSQWQPSLLPRPLILTSLPSSALSAVET